MNARGCQDHEESAVSKVASLSALKSVEAADAQTLEIVVIRHLVIIKILNYFSSIHYKLTLHLAMAV